MEHKSWIDYPEVKKLFDRVLKHRSNCKHWEKNNPCFDCHYDTLTKIEKELGIRL